MEDFEREDKAAVEDFEREDKGAVEDFEREDRTAVEDFEREDKGAMEDFEREGKITMEEYRHKVQYYETDRMGITHHSNYIRWMEEARIDFLDQIGWNYRKLEEMGIVSPVIAVDCRYRATTTFDDEICIAVSVREFKGAKLRLFYQMRKAGDGKLVLEGTTEHGFLDRQGRPIRMKKEYPELFQALTDQVVPE